MKDLLKRLEEASKGALFNFKSDWEKTLKNALGGYNGYTSFFDEINKLRRTKGYFSEQQDKALRKAEHSFNSFLDDFVNASGMIKMAIKRGEMSEGQENELKFAFGRVLRENIFMHPRTDGDYREMIKWLMDTIDSARKDSDFLETKVAKAEKEMKTLNNSVGSGDEGLVRKWVSELLYNRKAVAKAADKFLEISNGLYKLEKKYKGD